MRAWEGELEKELKGTVERICGSGDGEIDDFVCRSLSKKKERD